MRDTEVLRRRLWAQIGLPLATVAVLSACDNSAETRPVKPTKIANQKGDGGTKADDGPAKADKVVRKDTNAGAPGYVPPGRIEDIPEGEFDYFGAARDPFTDHEEEEGCPAGDWCGKATDARLFGIEHVPDKLGCPSKLIAQPQVTNALNKEDKRWEGLSLHPMMQGRLMTSVTKEKRAAGDEDICCYHWFEYCSGRPLLDGEDMIVAKLREGSNWMCDPSDVAAPADRPDSQLDDALRMRLGQLWAEDGLMEHAAIASFERATLELMAMAAPPALLGDVQSAAADEVDHAMRCFGLAARFSGIAREPGPLISLEPRVRGLAKVNEPDSGPDASPTAHSPDPSAGIREDWIRLALDTFVEGCVGETIATLIARRGQRHCEDPASLAVLGVIVDDEGRHAGLAWQTISWILVASGEHREAVLTAIGQQAEAMAAKAQEACEQLPAPDPQAAELGRYGRCDRRTEQLARRDAWSELILPTLEALTHADTSERGPEART